MYIIKYRYRNDSDFSFLHFFTEESMKDNLKFLRKESVYNCIKVYKEVEEEIKT
jgi:hypothetical protein